MEQLKLIAETPEIEQLLLERNRLNRGLLAQNTLRGYAHDWAVFCAWCAEQERAPLPASADTVSLYLTALLMRGRKVKTGTRRAAGIAHMHRANGFASPVDANARALLRATQRLRCEQPRQKLALSLADLRSICQLLAADGTVSALRNQALLLVGFASALRRASLSDLVMEDVEFGDRGLVLLVRREKQDQAGRGRWIGIPFGRSLETCPVRALRAWLDRRGSHPGPLFTRLDLPDLPGLRLAPKAICRIVQECVGRIGLSPALYGAHSLRAGFITEAIEAGASEMLVAAQTGHRSMEVLRTYFRRRDLFKANACSMIGL